MCFWQLWWNWDHILHGFIFDTFWCPFHTVTCFCSICLHWQLNNLCELQADTFLSTFYVLTHLILTTILGSRYCGTKKLKSWPGCKYPTSAKAGILNLRSLECVLLLHYINSIMEYNILHLNQSPLNILVGCLGLPFFFYKRNGSTKVKSF